MDFSFRQAGVVLAVLAAMVLTYPVASAGLGRDAWYVAVACLSIGFAYVGLRRHAPEHATPWKLLLTGFGAWAVSDLVALVEKHVVHATSYPLPSDILGLGGYVLLVLGFLAMARGQSSRDLTALQDAAIITTGTGVVAAVFVLGPITEDSTLNLAGKVVGSVYPMMDVLLIGLLVRLWFNPSGRTVSTKLLTAALAVNLLADVAWNASVVTSGSTETWVGLEMLWLAGFVLVAAAAWVPSMRDSYAPQPAGMSRFTAGARLVLLAGGLVLPGVTMLVDGARSGGPDAWLVTGAGSIALTLLVLSRMAGLLNVVQLQSEQLASAARSDALTGAPNRRTWDHELARACQNSLETGRPLCVAIVDLDHFKRFNDTFGHPAGDQLLREAVLVWSEELQDDEFLARYGGEEFALLFPGQSPIEARMRLDSLRALTPQGQTFSAGVALWDPESEPTAAVDAADAALYIAKRSGRNQVVLSDSAADDALPRPTIALQPIVDLATGEVVAEEALSRFEGQGTVSAFEAAHRLGRGPDLEISALLAALEHRRSDRLISLNITLDTLVNARAHELLPRDLNGVILEITEHGDEDHVPGTDELLGQLRRRGCAIAIDDWGKGHSNLDRMLRLRPEIIKLDMALVHGLESPYHRAIVHAITSWAEEVGALVCAEGIETPEQRAELIRLGVHLGQGYLFGRPEIPGVLPSRAVRRAEPVADVGTTNAVNGYTPGTSHREPETSASVG